MKLGIMGGTFNPVHNAHLLIASFAREEYGLDKVIFMTGGNTPHKETGGAAPEDRFNMVKLAAAGNEYFEASDYEIRKTEYSYTAETLAYLKTAYPDAELYFIVGGDSLDYIEKWHECEKIFSLCTLLVFKRPGFENTDEKKRSLETEYSCRIEEINAPIIEISSSMIRERIRSGKSVRYIMPDSVIDYIKENRLYE